MRLGTFELRTRGWSQSMIQRFLGPGERVKNPASSFGGMMLVWDEEKVVAAEETSEFRKAKQAAEMRAARHTPESKLHHSIKAKESSEARRKLELQAVASSQVTIFKCSLYELYRRMAEDRFGIYEWKINEGLFDFSQEKINSLAVSHALTSRCDLQNLMNRYRGRLPRYEVESILTNCALRAIAEAWPNLSSECERRLDILL